MKEEITAYVTKYALTTGIFKIKGELCDSNTFSYKMPGCYSVYATGKEWQKTEKEALEIAEEMRLSKIKSHKKAIEKLENLKFEIKGY